MAKKSVYLVDGTSICYRSFFAIKLSTSVGFPTGAIYGFFQTLRKIISAYNPEYMGICFDVSRKTFRQEKFKEYKIQRPPLPSGLKAQIPLIKKLIAFMGLTLIEKENFEADDIIASLSRRAFKDNLSVVIVSSDKDVFQLLEGRDVIVYNPNQEKFMDEDDFTKEFDFPPSSIVDYLSLAGDSVDNVPGAKGIGKVGALKLTREFKTVEDIFNNLDKISPNLSRILLENKDNIFLSKELVSLSFPDLDLTPKDLERKEPNHAEIYKLFQELEFKSLLKEIPTSSLNLKIKVEEVALGELKTDKLIFFTEGEDAYIFVKEDFVYKTNVTAINSLLEDDNCKKISYDFKSQMLSGIRMKGVWFDVKVAAYLIDSSFPDYALTTLLSRYLGQFLSSVSFEATPYFIYQLYQIFSPRLKEEALEKLFFEVEMPLVYVLEDMQNWGVKIDVEVLENLSCEVDERLGGLEREIFKIAQRKFNLNSPVALREVLFQELKMPPLKKTKTGYSTSEEVLEKLSRQFPIARFLLEYRHLNKLKTTYILPFIEDVKKKGGNLHARFNQTATQTGRLSSSSPNLQSIPVKGEFSSSLRRAFISRFKAGCLVSGDYSQIELRILAHFSQEERLIEAFRKNKDIHRHTASSIFGIKEEEVTDAQRDIAKRVNFGIIYGMSSYGLSRELEVAVDEAEKFIADYFLRYPRVRDYIQKVYTEVEEKGYAQTILGRRRYLPDIKSSNPALREFARRCAINTPIQGSSADIIKVAMVRIYNEFKERKLKSRLIIQIHDELLFDVSFLELEELTAIVKSNMEESVKLNVPVKINLKRGKNWGEMEEVL